MSQFFMVQDDGAVPRSPMPPVVKGLSSGNTALPESALATGAAMRSASVVTSSRADNAPCPTGQQRGSRELRYRGGSPQLLDRRRRQRRAPGRGSAHARIAHRTFIGGELHRLYVFETARWATPRSESAIRQARLPTIRACSGPVTSSL